MWLEALSGAAAAAGIGTLSYGVRGRSSQMFGRSVWRGPASEKAVAITFDDGPSEATPEVLRLLKDYDARATFFQCGANLRRLPKVGRAVAAAGHEIGNHTENHSRLYLQPFETIRRELKQCQQTIAEATGHPARLFRAPYGARWFGLRQVQEELGLTGVMWTAIGGDWRLRAHEIVDRLRPAFAPGAILCLHDGRQLQPEPDIRETLEALSRILPVLRDQGFRFHTVSDLLCRKFPPPTI
jgi:peptidoglycan-N-acetylglucosamine deacetylase